MNPLFLSTDFRYWNDAVRNKLLKPIPVRDLLLKLASGGFAVPGQRVPTVEILQTHWKELVGPAVSRESRPLRVQKNQRGSQLIIEVTHPAWTQEMSFLKEGLLRTIAELCPGENINEIRCQNTTRSKGSI